MSKVCHRALSGVALAATLPSVLYYVSNPLDGVSLLPVLRDHGLPLLAHAELALDSGGKSGSPRAYRSYLESRPRAWGKRKISAR